MRRAQVRLTTSADHLGQRKRVKWILDADIRGFFDQMSHEYTIKFVQHRVTDSRITRLIQKWLKAGVSEDGEWSETEIGTPQGAVISPLLANPYLHHVLDLWADVWRNKVAKGDVIVVRYARSRRQARGEGEPEKFTFLGFTHRCGTNSRGNFVIWRQTERKRLEAKLQQVKQALKERMHEPVPETGKWLGRVLNGFYQYHAVPGNWASLDRFRERVSRYWRQVLEKGAANGAG